jgi:hypothetical protein
MYEELSSRDLDDERIELLPARETLFYNSNWANIWASNSSMALNAASVNAFAHSTAVQSVTVNQG